MYGLLYTYTWPVEIYGFIRPYMCGHLKEAIYASGCWDRYPWSQPLCSRYTAVYGISAEGEAVRERAIFFVIYTHSDRGPGSGARCVTASIDL